MLYYNIIYCNIFICFNGNKINVTAVTFIITKIFLSKNGVV